MQKFVHPDNWDSSINRVRGSSTDVKKTNEFLDREKGRIIWMKDEMLNKGEEITAEKLKDRYLGVSEKSSKRFLVFFKEHNESMQKRIGKDFAEATWKRYETTYGHVESFLSQKYFK